MTFKPFSSFDKHVDLTISPLDITKSIFDVFDFELGINHPKHIPLMILQLSSNRFNFRFCNLIL